MAVCHTICLSLSLTCTFLDHPPPSCLSLSLSISPSYPSPPCLSLCPSWRSVGSGVGSRGRGLSVGSGVGSRGRGLSVGSGVGSRGRGGQWGAVLALVVVEVSGERYWLSWLCSGIILINGQPLPGATGGNMTTLSVAITTGLCLNPPNRLLHQPDPRGPWDCGAHWDIISQQLHTAIKSRRNPHSA